VKRYSSASVSSTSCNRDEAAPPSNAGKRLRLARWLKGNGIEIGALHHPLAVPSTAQVTYVDRLPESELRRHYPELAGEPFAPVTMIGNAQDLSALTDESVDFVIANHLLEHLEDPIAALVEFHRVLRLDGVLYLALPDPRVSFDRDRKLTAVDHVLQEHRHGTAGNRREHYLDWAAQVDKHPEPEAHAARLMAMDYSIHFHVWRPDSFLEFLVSAKQEAGLDLELAAFAPPESADDNEFILILLKGACSRLRLPADDGEGWAERRPDLRARLRRSRLGPILRPAYRLLRRGWSKGHRLAAS
jgi:SAM-dependent methyltransferase